MPRRRLFSRLARSGLPQLGPTRWPLARVADQVRRRFGVEYTLGGVHVLLHRIGWSVQVPARRAAERDEAAVAAWKGETWPVTKGRPNGRVPGWSSRTSRASLKPLKGRIWGRRGRTPVVTMTGGSNKRVSLAALIAVKAGQQPRLIFRVHPGPAPGKRKGFTERDYARLLGAAHH